MELIKTQAKSRCGESDLMILVDVANQDTDQDTDQDDMIV